MRRAILAGVETIHTATAARGIFRLMKEKGTAICPTLSVAGANADKRKLFSKQALRCRRHHCQRQRSLVFFAHWHNAREMKRCRVGCRSSMRCARDVRDAGASHGGQDGRVKPDCCDLIAVEGDPTR